MMPLIRSAFGILFTFQIKKNAAEAAKMIRPALSEAVKFRLAETGARHFAREALAWKTENDPA